MNQFFQFQLNVLTFPTDDNKDPLLITDAGVREKFTDFLIPDTEAGGVYVLVTVAPECTFNCGWFVDIWSDPDILIPAIYSQLNQTKNIYEAVRVKLTVRSDCLSTVAAQQTDAQSIFYTCALVIKLPITPSLHL